MGSFCKYCGKELVDGKCDCAGFIAANSGAPVPPQPQPQPQPQPTPGYNQQFDPNQQYYAQGQYQQQFINQSAGKDPLIIPKFGLDFSSLSSFFSSIRDQTGMSEPESSKKDPFEHDVPIVPNCIEPEENEIVVKQYNIAKLRTRLKFMKAEGRMMVTNRRVIFRAAGTSLTGNILQQHQFSLDKIDGIQMHKDYKFSLLNLFGCILMQLACVGLVVFVLYNLLTRSDSGEGTIVALGTVFGIIGVIPSFIVYKRFWFKTFCSVLANCFLWSALAASQGSGFIIALLVIASIITIINFVIVCFVPNLVINVKTAAGSPIKIGSQRAIFIRQVGEEYTGFAEILPWEDTIMAMNEIGTMIDDLQKHGDYAIEKWSR